MPEQQRPKHSPYRSRYPSKPKAARLARLAWAHIGRGLGIRLLARAERRRAKSASPPEVRPPPRETEQMPRAPQRSIVGPWLLGLFAIHMIRLAAGVGAATSPPTIRQGQPIPPSAETLAQRRAEMRRVLEERFERDQRRDAESSARPFDEPGCTEYVEPFEAMPAVPCAP